MTPIKTLICACIILVTNIFVDYRYRYQYRLQEAGKYLIPNIFLISNTNSLFYIEANVIIMPFVFLFYHQINFLSSFLSGLVKQ